MLLLLNYLLLCNLHVSKALHCLISLLFVYQHNTNGFWKSVARHVPREASDMRILNPYFIQEASFKLIGLPRNNGQMGKGVRHMLFS